MSSERARWRGDWGLVGVASLLLAGACAEPEAVVAPSWPVPREAARLEAWRQVVPPAEPVSGLTFGPVNNNLDVALWHDRLYLAVRTARTHFADPEARIVLLESADATTTPRWSLALTVQTGRDLREPRLFVWRDRLYLYVTELGSNPTAFEPGRVLAWSRAATGPWEGPRVVFADGTLVWRVKVRRGRLFATAYRGGERIYQGRGEGGGVELMFLESEDGWHWHGVDGAGPVVLVGGVSEVGFEFTEAGDLVAVGRNEAGDASGFGSRLCTAPAAALGRWRCSARSDPHKYDSPFMFRWREHLYLVARYNPDGPYDLEPGAPVGFDRFLRNEVRYSLTTKRTALYGVAADGSAVYLLAVLPSNGDTAFASGVWTTPDRLLLFNYSSGLTGPDKSWIEGQLTGSEIYASAWDFAQAAPQEGRRMW